MKLLSIICVPVLIFLTHPAAASAESSPEPYLGETPPGLSPELFAPGVVSTNAVELNSVFTPDGREFFFLTPDGKYLFFSRRSSQPPDGGWPHVVAGGIYWVDATVIERLRPGAADTEVEE